MMQLHDNEFSLATAQKNRLVGPQGVLHSLHSLTKLDTVYSHAPYRDNCFTKCLPKYPQPPTTIESFEREVFVLQG